MTQTLDYASFHSRDEFKGLEAAKKYIVKNEMKLSYVAWLLVIGLASQKLSITIVKGTALEIALPILYMQIIFMIAKGMIEIKPLSFIAVLCFLCLATVCAIATDSKFTSMFYVYLNYIPFIFCVRISEENYTRFIKIHQMFMGFAAIMVFCDWAFQLAHKPMPNMEHFIPGNLRFFNFNYIQPLKWGSSYVKPNSFIFLETSYLSQAIATAFIIEFCLFRRTFWMALFLSALVLTYGGTGFALLALSTPVLMHHVRAKTLAMAIGLTPLALLLALSSGMIDNFQYRMKEFGQQNSSADHRFNAQAEEFSRHAADPMSLLHGIGAGNTTAGTNIVWIPPVKVSIEYGIIVGCAFVILIIYSAMSGGTPIAISYPVIIQYMFLNGGFLVPISVFYLLIMACLVKPTKDKDSPCAPHGKSANQKMGLI